MSIKNNLLIGATALGLGTAANAQTEEHFSCGHDHTKNSPNEQSIQPRDGNYMWNDCDTIRTALISILPAPRADNRDMFYEGLQNVADQTDIEAIENVKHVQMNWAEMAPWLQHEGTSQNAHSTFAALQYDSMPAPLADTIKNIIAQHGPDIIILELPGNFPGKGGAALGGAGRGMVMIKSVNSDVMYKCVVGHEIGHENSLQHDDNTNNIMNENISGNTSSEFTDAHKVQINENYKPYLIDMNPDRNCEIVGIDDPEGLADGIRLYPNPVDISHFTLESVATPITRVRVFDAVGKLYTYMPREADARVLDVSTEGLSAGVRYVTIETSKGNITKKFVIIR